MRIHRNSLRNFLLAAVAIFVAAVFVSTSLASPGRSRPDSDAKKPVGRYAGGPAQRKTLLEAWKEQRRAQGAKGVYRAQAFGGVPALGRPSIVINSTGATLYTKHFAGSACDPDLTQPDFWFPSTAHAANDFVSPDTGGGGFVFRATNAGTTGTTEPAWPTTFGATVIDGTITWQASDNFWVASRAYPIGTVVSPSFRRFGFTFLATQAGTTGGTPPAWPTVIGGTVTDGTVIWQAKAWWPGQFAGCDPMQLISRASGGAETVLAQEGAPVGGSGVQLSGWSEFYAFNNLGRAAFRSEAAGRLTDEDEGGSSIFTAGPGAGALTEIAQSNTVVGGRTMCGFSALVGMNDAGQVLYDAYERVVFPAWQASHTYAPFSQILPTVPNGFDFTSNNNVPAASGATEPVWPTSPGATVVDGAITWTAEVRGCNEDFHGITRFTSGPGNELLMAVGTNVGGATVVGFGNDSPPALNTCSGCAYGDIDGFINASGHASTAVLLSTDDTAAYLLTGPGTFTQVARTGTAGSGGTFGRVYSRTALNASDQVLFKAAVGGVDKMIRWTGPATFATVASVGDDIGTREGGAATGETMIDLGFYGDINALGNVVFQATLSSGPHAYYFWNSTTSHITEIARDDFVPMAGTTGKAVRAARATTALVILPHNLSSEMVTLNDSNVAAFTSGAGDPESTEEGAEGQESGFHLWTATGGVQNLVKSGDVIGGQTVGFVNAQHPSFRRRQLNSAGCAATQYYFVGAPSGSDEDAPSEGFSTPKPRAGLPPGGQLFVGCSQQVIPTPTVTSTPPPNATPTPIPTGNPGAAAGIPTLSGRMLALFALALAAAASLILLVRKR